MTKIHYGHNGTACPISKHLFAQCVANNIVENLGPSYMGGTACISGYTPPQEDLIFPDGFIEFCIQKSGLDDAPIGIEFGTTTKEGRILTCDFDYVVWHDSGRSPIAGRIVAANFLYYHQPG